MSVEAGAGFTVSNKSTVHQSNGTTSGGGGITFNGDKYITLEDREKIREKEQQQLFLFVGLAAIVVILNLIKR